MTIFALDPGCTVSAYVLYDDKKGIVSHWCDRNEVILSQLERPCIATIYACEWIESYGMAVGAEVFHTCRWVGRFQQIRPYMKLVPRRDVKLHLCNSPRAKDANIRQALIDKLGKPGTKKNPGKTYGIASHCWAALGVAVTVAETVQKGYEP